MKKLFTFFILALTLNQVSAQFNQNWSSNYMHTSSLNFSNESRKMVKDPSGNIYVLADATSDIDPLGQPASITYHYTVLLKYDNAGSLVHSRVVNVIDHMVSGFDNRGAFGIEYGTGGFIYIGFNSFNATSGFDVNISKYNTSTMQRLWIWTYNPSTTDKGIDMKLGTNGKVFAILQAVNAGASTYHIVAAETTGTATTSLYAFDIDADFLNSMVLDGNNDIFVTGYRFIAGVKNSLTAAVNEAGALKWKKTFNGGTIVRDDQGRQIILATDNYVYICGSSDRGVPNLTDVMVLGYHKTNGKFKWVNYFDYQATNDFGYTLKQTDANNLYVAAATGNTAIVTRLTMDYGSLTGRGIFEPIPSTPYSSLNGVSIAEMEVSSAKNIYLAGTILATDQAINPFSASWLVKLKPVSYRSNGINVLKYDFDLGVQGSNAGSYLATDILLDGATNTVYMLQDKIVTYSNHSEETIQLSALGISSPARTGITGENENELITVGPNPIHDYIEINATEGLSQVDIMDQTGKQISSLSADNAPSLKIDLPGLAPGIYFINIQTESGSTEIRKLIKY